MPKNVTQYDLLISCPGDIQEDELTAIDSAVSDFNRTYEDVLSLRVRTKHWQKDSYAESGDEPQALLNKQFVSECDAAVALFWTRFGTPTDQYGSGTEEEIEIMLETGKQVFLGFSENPIPPSSLSSNDMIDEYAKVQAFKEGYRNRGIYFTYSSANDLHKKFYAHLSKHFLSLSCLEEAENKHQPLLYVKSIIEKSFSDYLVPSKILVPYDFDTEYGSIRLQIEKISQYKLKKFNQMTEIMREKVEIKEGVVKRITAFSNKFNIKLPDDFFVLGNLRKSKIPVDIFGAQSLEGEKDEIEKYRAINALSDSIHLYISWKLVSNTYEDFSCIKLALLNEGSTFDEDVEIKLFFPKNMLINHLRLPMPSETAMSIINEEGDFFDLFCIAETSKYIDYSSSKTSRDVPAYVPPSVSPFYASSSSAEDSFYENLDEVFEYSSFIEDDTVILKIRFDYIKHNTAVAFPCVLFVNETSISDVDYQITSKYVDSVCTGTIPKEII